MSRGEEAARILLRRTHAKRAGFHMGDNEFELTGGGDISFSTQRMPCLAGVVHLPTVGVTLGMSR